MRFSRDASGGSEAGADVPKAKGVTESGAAASGRGLWGGGWEAGEPSLSAHGARASAASPWEGGNYRPRNIAATNMSESERSNAIRSCANRGALFGRNIASGGACIVARA